MRGLMARKRRGKGESKDSGLSYDSGKSKPKKPKAPKSRKRRSYGDGY